MFDRVSFSATKEALRLVNILDSVIRWHDNLLKHRSVSANLRGTLCTIKLGRGSPQGNIIKDGMELGAANGVEEIANQSGRIC